MLYGMKLAAESNAPRIQSEDEITSRRFPIILLNKTQLMYLEEYEIAGDVRRNVSSWERIPEVKRR